MFEHDSMSEQPDMLHPCAADANARMEQSWMQLQGHEAESWVFVMGAKKCRIDSLHAYYQRRIIGSLEDLESLLEEDDLGVFTRMYAFKKRWDEICRESHKIEHVLQRKVTDTDTSWQPILDHFKTILVIGNEAWEAMWSSMLHREAGERIDSLKWKIEIHFNRLLKKEPMFMQEFFVGITPGFFTWQEQYHALTNEVEYISTLDLRGMVVSLRDIEPSNPQFFSGPEYLARATAILDKGQRIAIEAASAYMLALVSEKKNSLADCYANALKTSPLIVKAFENDASKLIRQFNTDALRIGSEGIPALNAIRVENDKHFKKIVQKNVARLRAAESHS